MKKTSNRTPRSSSRFSTRALRALSAFGLTVDDVHTHPHTADRVDRVADALDARLASGHIAFISGPSGSGKSSLLRTLSRRRGTFITVQPASHMFRFRGRAVDVVGHCSLDRAMNLLAAAGLADARLMVTRVAELSEGERARVALARAMEQADTHRAHTVTLIIDEFGASLDHITGAAVATSLARWARKPGTRVRIVAAGTRRAAARALRPDLHVALPACWAWDTRAKPRMNKAA